MRNRKICLLVAVVLVVALMATLVIGCTPKGNGPEENSNPSFGNGDKKADAFANAYEIQNGVDKFVQFELYANPNKVTSVDGKVKVYDLSRKEVAVKVVSLGSGVYKVYAPDGGYELGQKYVMSVGEGVSFVDYQGVTKVAFTVSLDMQSNVQYKNGVVVVDSSLVNTQQKVGNDKNDGTEFGYININHNGAFTLEEGNVFIVNNKETALQEAFKIKSIKDSGLAGYSIDYIKPNLEEVFDDFAYTGIEELDEDNLDQIEMFAGESLDAVVEELENSQMAQTIAGIFGAAPKFDVAVNMEGKELVATITIQVKNVVYTDGGNADLVFKIQNRLGAVVTSNISNDKVNNKYDVAFDVNADVANRVLFNVGIFAQGSYSKVENIQGMIDKIQLEGMENVKNEEEIIAKIEAVDEATKTGEDDINVKIFKWTLPIADGAASISYDADLAFNFNFSGQFGVAAETTLNYKVGASYNVKDGIKTYAEAAEDNKACDQVSIKLDGKADVRVGINQRIGLDVLAGVLGVGLKANLGNFNRLYGYADAKWVAADEKNANGYYDMVVADKFNGTMYLEGGIYWDVNVDLGVKVGSLINLQKGVNVATGEKVLYTGGSQEVVRHIVADGLKENQVFNLAAQNTTLNFDKKVYNVLKKAYEYVDVEDGSVVVEKANNSSKYNVALVNGVWELTIVNPGAAVDNIQLNVTYNYKDCFGQDKAQTDVVSYYYSGALVLDKDEYVQDKNTNKKDLQVVVISTQGEPTLTIDGANVNATVANVGNEYTMTIKYQDLNKLVSGTKTLTATVGSKSVSANLVIKGQVAVDSERSNGSIYNVYCADQIIDLMYRGNEFDSAAIFEITEDIDMNGVVLNTLPEFSAKINGFGHVISNYKTAGALFNVNNGEINNVTFAGDTNVELKIATRTDYNIAGVVGVNNGTLNNVNFKGNVTVKSVGLQAFSTVNVAAIAATNNGTMENCDVLGAKISVTYKFDLANVKYNIGAVTANASDINAEIVYDCEAGAKNNITKVNVAK